jgi:hypothetical protein
MNTNIETAVSQFIDHFTQNGKRKEVIDCFTNGCCFWFAYTLHGRFIVEAPGVIIVYDDIMNHFGCRINGRVYDITGDVTDKYNWRDWIEVHREDILRGNRIIRDCVNF